VRELELALGEALFVRQPGRLKPTERAHALYGAVSAMKGSVREADIAVRFFRPEQDGVIAVHVGDTELGLYAHESLLQRHGEPQGFDVPDDLFVAGFDREVTPLAPMLRGKPPARAVRFRFRTDAMLARNAAVETGLGIGAYLVDVAAAKPCLRRVLAERFSLKQEVWLCAHDELRRSASMRYVWNQLERVLRARLAPVPGRPGL